MSHDLLDDLLADVPRHVMADPAVAWRAGTRRQRQRYVVEALAVAAAVALVGLGLVRLHDHTPVQPVDPSKTVDGYPRDVPRPFFSPAMPDAPGAAAGVVSGQGWQLVGADGETWQLDADDSMPPVLSDDGTRLALMGDVGGTIRLKTLNLVTGAVRTYPEVDRDSISVTRHGYWSPDGDSLLLPQGASFADTRSALVLRDGEVMVVRRASPVGWTSESTIGWLSNDHGTFLVTDARGQVVRRVRVTKEQRPVFVDDAEVSPDGTEVALLAEANSSVEVQVFSLETGQRLSATDVPGVDQPTQVVWRGADVLCWVGHQLVDPTDGRPVVRLAERWDTGWVAWATDSLDGPAHDGPSRLAWRYWPFWWWWKAGLGGLGVLTGLLLLWRLDLWDRRRNLRAT